MPREGSTRDAVEQDATAVLYRRQVPAWLLSLGVHTAFFIAVALIVPRLPQGAAQQTVRAGGIVLVDRTSGPPRYFSEEEAGGKLAADDAQGRDAETQTAGGAATAKPLETPSELEGLLPRGSEAITGSEAIGAGAEKATAMTAGAGTPGAKFGAGHSYAETSVFGVKGRGNKFVYVFDRSGSMEGFQGRPLAAAKRELLASLDSLDTVHQFQIIFYNQNPTILNPDRSAHARMLFGNEGDKKIASDFVKGILADGATAHLDALRMALKMRPDVVFFLTDSGEPQMTQAELAEVRRLNESVGASISAIEFGAGPSTDSNTFLAVIARQNGGSYAYVDVTKLPRK